jgi:hypothetical protein
VWRLGLYRLDPYPCDRRRAAQSEGYAPERIRDLFAVNLTLAQVYSALAYADENQEEIEAEYAEHERAFDEGVRFRDEHLEARSLTER